MACAAPFLVTDIEAAQFAKLVAENKSSLVKSEKPKAPTKQSPAPTVSTALTNFC